MLVMITLVSLCIFVFSIGYMTADKNFTRFFAYLSFFSAAMLGVVISNSLLLLFVCWELVGLASYLLIGFWIERPSAAAAAKKAFITTRIGDLGLFLGMLWLYHRSGTLLFYDRGGGCLESVALLSLGGCGHRDCASDFLRRHRQVRPISAARLVARRDGRSDSGERSDPCRDHGCGRGVPGRARLSRFFPSAPINGVTQSLTVVVWIGVITGLMAALIAIAQSDIKRILAYSTVSQLGLMMVSLGVGGWPAGIMHLLAHGFFKALLFLGAGSVIHGLHHEQDIRKMGGLRRANAPDLCNLCHWHDGAERRAARFLRRVDQGGNSARNIALAEIAPAALPDDDRRRPDRVLHDSADDLRLLRRAAALPPNMPTKVRES